MPPSSPVAGSGAWRTAQRTIKNSATIGIFSRNISQMKVHASTPTIVYPVGDPLNPQGAGKRQLPPPITHPRNGKTAPRPASGISGSN